MVDGSKLQYGGGGFGQKAGDGRKGSSAVKFL